MPNDWGRRERERKRRERKKLLIKKLPNDVTIQRFGLD
jgi:hypothetical protein